MLDGVGDAALGEWVSDTASQDGLAFVHLRRRLSVSEASAVGQAIDYRQTPTHHRLAIKAQRHGVPLQFALDER